MREVHTCPACGFSESGMLHSITVEDRYPSPEPHLMRTASYQRNYILFEHILHRAQNSIVINFKICHDCGLIFFSPRPTDANLRVKYAMIATDHETERREEAHKLVDLRRDRGRAIYKRVKPLLRPGAGSALDVGGADGHCLGEFVGQLDCNIVDFEKRDMWPGVRRIGASTGDIDPAKRFDLIVSCHTLEHVDSPMEFIREFYERLNDGGLIYIEVPYGCHDEIYRTDNFITHLNFFSTASLAELLLRSGFQVAQSFTGPVLSRKRYLPVIAIVGRKNSAASPAKSPIGTAYRETINEMKRSIDQNVLMANVGLVLQKPVSYAKAFGRRVLPRI